MHDFGDNFVTLGQNMDINEYCCPNSDAAAHYEYDWYD